ncbi:hypothetical protein ACHAPT_008627 [Fusarium lateritium]
MAGELPNRTAPATPGVSDEPTSELEQLILNLHSSITHLFSLSTLIRRRRPKGRLPKPDGFVPFETSPDIKHVEDKFPKVRHTPWLAKRLGNAITQRRQIIQYRQSHRDRLATVAPEESVETATSMKRPSGTVATTYEEATQAETRGPGDRRSMRHVFSDLQPYVCTFEDCSSDLFASRKEWFSHEISTHRQDWICIQCRDSSTIFQSLAALKSHFEVKHPDEITHNRLETILEACQCPPKRIDSSGCLLCDDWDPPAADSKNVKEFCRHLARHQQMLALEALPISIEGLELKPAAFDFGSDQDPEDQDPQMVRCSDCEAVWTEDAYGKSCPECPPVGRSTWQEVTLTTLSRLPEGWQEMITSDKRVYFKGRVAVWPEGLPPGESARAGGAGITQIESSQGDGGEQQIPSLHNSYHDDPPHPENPIPKARFSIWGTKDKETKGMAKFTGEVIWLAASLFEFRLATTKEVAGYPYLTYNHGEVFDVFAEKTMAEVGLPEKEDGSDGELWLVRNQDDPDEQLGWVWSKHFAKLSED